MDHFFSIRSVPSEKKFHEISKYGQDTKDKCKAFFLYLILILMFSYAVYLSIDFLSYELSAADYLILSLAWLMIFAGFARAIFRHKRYARKIAKRYPNSNNGAPQYTTALFYEEYFYYKSAHSPSNDNVYYSDIIRIFETPNYFCVETSSRLIYSFDKAGFETNNADEFLPFLRSRTGK